MEITVTRLSDKLVKTFFQAGHVTTVARMESFMDSITDDLADGYWPKEKKKKNVTPIDITEPIVHN